jgi:hypothetical protein
MSDFMASVAGHEHHLYPLRINGMKHCQFTAAGILREQLQIYTVGNKVEKDLEHIKCKCIFSTFV